jgi:uncharacterized membrane protein
MRAMTEHPTGGEPLQPEKRRARPFARLRGNFLTGLVVVLPIGLTIWLIWTVVGWIDAWVLPLVPASYQPQVLLNRLLGNENPSDPGWVHLNIRGMGVLVFVVFTVLTGWIAKGLIGRSFIRWTEQLVDRMPVVRSIYNGLKQIAETVFAKSENSFDKACLIEYPRRGIWGIGFISTYAKGEIARLGPKDDPLYSVFLPTTPNPTSGFLLFVPKSEIIELDMKVEDAAKLIISAGLVYPSAKDAKAAAEEIVRRAAE